jgi:hypothetical protein
MLDSYQISAALLARGLGRTLAKADRTKAHGYRSNTLTHPLFVRVGGAQGELRAVTDDPLALHPDEATKIRTSKVDVTGITLREQSNPSSAYVGFPPRIVNGRKSSYEGIRASVDDEPALDRLLSVLGHVAQRYDDPVAMDIDPLLLVSASNEVDGDPECEQFGPTTRKALIEARIGQGAFRGRMMEIWSGRCAITGCGVKRALIASHALAWKDSAPHERLDEYNGLLLTASIDRLFDSGLIGFDDDGRLLLKPDLDVDELAHLGLNEGSRLRFVRDNHKPYLAEHRKRYGF